MKKTGVLKLNVLVKFYAKIHEPKRQALEEFAHVFEDDRRGERSREAEQSIQIHGLSAEIGD